MDELVRDDQFQPVVVVRDAAAVHRGPREDGDPVVGARSGEAVGDVGVVGQQELDAAAGGVDEALLEEAPGAFRGGGGVPGDRGHPLRVGDGEVLGVELPPRLVGRGLLGGGGVGGGEEEDEGEERPERPHAPTNVR